MLEDCVSKMNTFLMARVSAMNYLFVVNTEYLHLSQTSMGALHAQQVLNGSQLCHTNYMYEGECSRLYASGVAAQLQVIRK